MRSGSINLTPLEDQQGLVRSAADALDNEDLPEVSSLVEEIQKNTTALRAAAQGFGFEECG